MLGVDQVLHERYRIVRQLGHGGMGAVYEAIDERFGGPIALKEIVFASQSEKQRELIVKAFEREAKALAKAQHEAIPYVRDYFTESDRQFLVMELIEGDDLAGMLTKRQAPFPLIDCLKWMDQLLDALDYLHTLEPPIVHRDIKPQNLKLNRRGRIKLLDFGIAKSSDAIGATLSDQTFVGATLDYSPIEQILRAIEPTFREYILLRHKAKADEVLGQTTDARCDIYSLGATFYHLLTNQPPPDAVKRTLELWEGRPDPLTDPSTLNPAIPPSVSACLLRAMSVEREDRFRSALEMQTALHGATSENKSLASRVYNDSWKDAQALRQGMEEEERRRREHELMLAQTVRLEPDSVPKLETGIENAPSLQSLPTEPFIVTPAETSQAAEVYVDPQPTPAFETAPSGRVSSGEFGDLPSIESRNTEAFQAKDAVPASYVPAPKRRSSAPYWIAAVAAAGTFAVAGIGGALWIADAGNSGNDNSARNINSSVPSPSPSPESTVSETGLTVEPTPTVTPRPTPAATPVRTPESTPQSTPYRTPQPTPVKTPKRTPTPRKTPDPNCVYNNTCK